MLMPKGTLRLRDSAMWYQTHGWVPLPVEFLSVFVPLDWVRGPDLPVLLPSEFAAQITAQSEYQRVTHMNWMNLEAGPAVLWKKNN